MVQVVERDSADAHWGIEELPPERKQLSGWQVGLLWADLGIGLLVLVSGALLVAPPPVGFALGLGPAFAAIVVGSIIGCTLLGVAGGLGAKSSRPTMALLRPLLSEKGSWVPTVLNVAQLIGWTAVELWAMGRVAAHVSEQLWGFSGFTVWVGFFTIAVVGLALWGPVGVVKRWMQRFGAWVLLVIGLFATIAVVMEASAAGLRWSGGGLSWLGVPMDVVIAMPVSWIPLVADYNRFASSARTAAIGTGIGYFIANVWFYALGAALIALSPQTSPGPEGIAAAILVIGGGTLAAAGMLMGLLVGETDEGFADVYSAAVSLRNIFPRVSSRVFVTAVGSLAAVLAASFTMQSYELFLLLLGSVFLPLAGVWLSNELFLEGRQPPRRIGAFLAWGIGFAVYHWIAPTPVDWWLSFTGRVAEPLSQRFVWLGASIPSLVTAGAIHVLINRTRST